MSLLRVSNTVGILPQVRPWITERPGKPRTRAALWCWRQQEEMKQLQKTWFSSAAPYPPGQGRVWARSWCGAVAKGLALLHRDQPTHGVFKSQDSTPAAPSRGTAGWQFTPACFLIHQPDAQVSRSWPLPASHIRPWETLSGFINPCCDSQVLGNSRHTTAIRFIADYMLPLHHSWEDAVQQRGRVA